MAAPPPPKSSLAAQIMAASEGAAPKLAEAIVYLKPVAKPIGFIAMMIIDYCGPFYIKLFQLGYRAYHELPKDVLSALLGLGLSFCGGAYCASIVAIEAVRMSGWDRTQAALEQIYTDARAMYEAYVADDSTSSDDDPLTRKLAVVAVAVKDPEQLSAALGGLYTSWLAVQAVLRTEFAKTITLGVSIAAMATPYLQKVGVPVLAHVVPREYHHWIPMLIANTARSIGIAVAWKMQAQHSAPGQARGRAPPSATSAPSALSAPSARTHRPRRAGGPLPTPSQEVVSAIHLALLGGLLFSRSLLRWARREGYALPAAEDTVLDEVAGYAVAALGFYYQYAWGFALPFPLSLLFFPLSWIEWYIRWAVTSTASIA